MEVLIRPVQREEKAMLSSMLDAYLDELAKFAQESFPKPYKFLDAYFSEESRHPFFILADRQIAGFALVNLKDPLSNREKQAISEFCILPKFRGQGLGEKGAEQLFDLFPGTWVIRELPGNPADNFWKKVIQNYTQGNYREYEESNENRKSKVQEFTNSK